MRMMITGLFLHCPTHSIVVSITVSTVDFILILLYSVSENRMRQKSKNVLGFSF